MCDKRPLKFCFIGVYADEIVARPLEFGFVYLFAVQFQACSPRMCLSPTQRQLRRFSPLGPGRGPFDQPPADVACHLCLLQRKRRLDVPYIPFPTVILPLPVDYAGGRQGRRWRLIDFVRGYCGALRGSGQPNKIAFTRGTRTAPMPARMVPMATTPFQIVGKSILSPSCV